MHGVITVTPLTQMCILSEPEQPKTGTLLDWVGDEEALRKLFVQLCSYANP